MYHLCGGGIITGAPGSTHGRVSAELAEKSTWPHGTSLTHQHCSYLQISCARSPTDSVAHVGLALIEC